MANSNHGGIVEKQWIDVHVHLDKLEEGPAAALELARSQGVHQVITIGTDPDDLPVVLKLAEEFAPMVFCTLGIHPHEAGLWDHHVRDFILANATRPRVVALGEMGLDYYYNNSTPQTQKRAFQDQMELAVELKLPVEIHTRDAEADTVELLRPFKGKVNGIIHCFTGTEWLARQCLDLGYDISISGVVTFKNADALRRVAEIVPLDRLHVETDAPFLSPVPHRGKKNTPAFMVHTAACIAQLKGISIETLSSQVWKNSRRLFPKLTSMAADY
jgi:TatD DNase family protein